MNTIFIDVYDFKENDKKSFTIIKKIKSKILKISITKDFTNDKFNKNILFKIDKLFLDRIIKNKCKLSEKVLKLLIKKEYGKDTKLNIVCSKKIDNNKSYKTYIMSLFTTTLNNIDICEIKVQNDILKHDTIYIDNMLKKSNINVSKANILIAINNINDIEKEKIIEYIKKYKYVDILRLSGISKTSYRTLLKKLDEINEEYGTTIEVIQRRNISEYDIYAIYSSINLDEFKNHYILNSNARILNTKNEEEDTLSLSYRIYNKYKYDIEALFNRIECDLNSFSKIKLGNLYR